KLESHFVGRGKASGGVFRAEGVWKQLEHGDLESFAGAQTGRSQCAKRPQGRMPGKRTILAHDDARPGLGVEVDSAPCPNIERGVAETNGKIDLAFGLAGYELDAWEHVLSDSHELLDHRAGLKGRLRR